MPAYKFYATLLDAYQWYLTSEQDEAFKEFIDKINRVPFTSEAADKGKAFNDCIDQNLFGINGFDFKPGLVNDFISYFNGAASQVFTKAQLQTNHGAVELYGYADKVLRDTVYDIKTTSKYEFPKYTLNWQHKVYPYCFRENDILVSNFEYTVTDFTNIYKEQYVYKPDQDKQSIKSICESLIEFIETHRALITDKKIFGII